MRVVQKVDLSKRFDKIQEKMQRNREMLFMKKILFIFVLAVLFAGVLPVSASDVSVSVNGVPVAFDIQGPVNIDGRVLVPARGVFDALGFTPSWNGELRQATLTSPQFVIVITIDSTAFTTNGQQHMFDVPAQIINDTTMIPLGAVLRSIDIEPGWDAATSTVVISLQGEEAPPPAEYESVQWTIIGAWDWMGERYYMFNADGSGVRGAFGNYEHFTWTDANGVLTIDAGTVREQWNYVISGNLLIMSSLQVSAFSFIYTRNGVTVPGVSRAMTAYFPANAYGLVGAWYYQGRPYYVFNADGSGVRGEAGRYQHFRWGVSGGVLYIGGAGALEQWTYVLTYGGLILKIAEYGVFEYTRH